MAPKAKRDLAKEHLKGARQNLAAGDERDAINALFYAAEAAVVALADEAGLATKKNHAAKADAAAELHRRGILDADYGPLLQRLNQARKDVWYEGDDPDFGEDDLEDIAGQVEALVDAAGELKS